MPLISLIVPFYNEASHLRRCISSIFKQTFNDFEVLMVDDQSSDDSFALVTSLTSGDPRFCLMHNDVKGLYHARNMALADARGQYICFLDADDELLPDYLLGLYQDAQIAPVDLIIQGYSHVFADHSVDYRVHQPGLYHLSFGKETADTNKNCSLFNAFDPVALAHIPGKLYRKELIDRYHIRFSEHVLICEDMFFFFSYLSVCHPIYLSNKSNYLYIANSNSMTSSYWDFETEERSYLEMKKIWEHILSLYDCPSLQSGYGTFTGSYVNRLLFSALFHPRSISSKKTNLINIQRAYLPLYSNSFVPPTVFTRLLKMTALRGWYFLYAMLMKLANLRYHIQVNYR